MTKAITQFHKEKIIFWTLFGILVISIAFYMYCISATVHNIVLREKLESQATQLALDISNKEFQYISMRNSITLDYAHTIGFKDVPQKTFLTKGADSVVSYLPKGL